MQAGIGTPLASDTDVEPQTMLALSLWACVGCAAHTGHSLVPVDRRQQRPSSLPLTAAWKPKTVMHAPSWKTVFVLLSLLFTVGCLSVQVSVLPRCNSVSAVLDAHSLSQGLQVGHCIASTSPHVLHTAFLCLWH